MRDAWMRALLSASLFAAIGCSSVNGPGAIHTSAARDSTVPAHDAEWAFVDAEHARLVREGAVRASIVVLDPRTGNVLAASGAVDRAVAIGSTAKPITVAAALEAGMSPSHGLAAAPGGDTLRDYAPHPTLNVGEVIVYSSNVGAERLVHALGEGPIRRMFDAVGLRSRERWHEEAASFAAGLDVQATPTTIARAYGAIANDGVLIDASGARRQVMSPETAQAIRGLLIEATGERGTGQRARVEGLRVGGKTGTAGPPRPEQAQNVAFVGMFPGDSPTHVIAVMAEVHEGYGGSVAAPAFARLARQIATMPRPTD